MRPLKLLFILLHSAHCISHMTRLAQTFALVWKKPLSQPAGLWTSADAHCGKYVRAFSLKLTEVFYISYKSSAQAAGLSLCPHCLYNMIQNV